MRTRGLEEIIPVSTEQSHNNKQHSAERAFDLDLMTFAAAPEGSFWIKAVLDKVYCILEVTWKYSSNAPRLTWSCGETGCDVCDGSECDSFTMIVSDELSGNQKSPVSGCKYGNIVKLETMDGTTTSGFRLYEIAIIEKQGKHKSKNNKISSRHLSHNDYHS